MRLAVAALLARVPIPAQAETPDEGHSPAR